MKKILQILALFLLGFNTLFGQDVWINNMMGSFEHPNNILNNGLTVFGNQLYTATGQDSGYVYRTLTGQRNSWEKVFYQPDITSVTAINSTPGNIYISGYMGYNSTAGYNPDSTIIFHSTDGSSNWTPLNGFKGTGNFIIPFNDSLYVIKNGANGSEILKHDTINTTTPWAQTGFVNNNFYSINSTCIHNSKLYIGTNQGSTYSCSIWSSADGIAWVKDTTTVFGTTMSITAMESFGGYLYVGTENYNGAQIWKTNNNVNWSLVANYPSNINKVTSLQVISTQLCATLQGPNYTMGGSGTAAIVRNVSSPFNYSVNDGFGISGLNGSNGSAIQFGNNIYYACSYSSTRGTRTNSDNGSQIWKLCLGTSPTVTLGPDITVCAGVTHTFTAVTSATSFVWCDNSTDQTYNASYPQDYSVTVMGTNGCESTDTVVLKNIPSPTISRNGYELPYLCKGDTLHDTIHVSAYSNLRVTLTAIPKVLINPLHILDAQSSYDTLMVPAIAHDDGAANSLVSVTIDSLYHTSDYDLSIRLISPDGTSIALASYGNGLNYIGTKFISNSTNSIYNGNGPYTGTFAPVDPFNLLSGPTNGKWILQITDNYTGNTGFLKGWSLQFSQIDTAVTFSLSPAIGLSSTNSPSIRVFPTISTVYTITATNGTNSCSSYDSLRIEVPGLQINPHLAHICKGMSDSLSAQIIGLSQSGTTNPPHFHWSNNAGLIDSIASGITVTPNSTIKYYAMDTISGCFIKDSTDVNVDPQLFITASSSPTPICFGDTATLTGSASGGTSPYSYSWNDGDTNFPGQNLLVTPITGMPYFLEVTDSWGCSTSDTTSVSVTPSTDIYGHIDSAGVSGTSILNGYVVIYKYLPSQTHFDTLDVVSVDGSGNYHFTGINHGTYLLKVFANTTDYPTAMPTYFGNQFLWTAATITNHGCNFNDTSNISVIFPQTVPPGPGFIGGIIREGAGFVRQESDPIPGVDVKLGRNPGGIIAHTQTDSSGYYHFNNLALNSVVGGSYILYADIPGIGIASSYNIILDQTNPSYDSLNYVVDSTIRIVPTSSTGINNSGDDMTKYFTVYPNPFKENTSIEYNVPVEANVTLEVVNVLGVKIKSLVNSKQSAGNHKCSLNTQSNHLSAGVYFITLTINEKSTTQRIVLIE